MVRTPPSVEVVAARDSDGAVAACSDGVRLFAAEQECVTAYELRSGELLWTTDVETDDDDPRLHLAGGGLVLMDGRVIAFDPRTGEVVAEGDEVDHSVESDPPGVDLRREGGGALVDASGEWIAGVSVVPGRDVLRVMAVDGGWEAIAPSGTDHVILHDGVIFANGLGGLLGYDLESGSIVFARAAIRSLIDGGPMTVSGDLLIVPMSDCRIVVVRVVRDGGPTAVAAAELALTLGYSDRVQARAQEIVAERPALTN